jgi:hypothetical protein
MPDEECWKRLDLDVTPMGEAEIATRLREELSTPALCDEYLHDLAFNVGRLEHQYSELVQWAEGDEATVVALHKDIARFRTAINEALGNVLRWKATLEADREAGQRPGRQS